MYLLNVSFKLATYFLFRANLLQEMKMSHQTIKKYRTIIVATYILRV